MTRKSSKSEPESLASKLASLPESSRWIQQNPFENQLSSDQLAEWVLVKRDYQDGKFNHVSLTQLRKYVLNHFGMRAMSFDKFKSELEGRRSSK